MFKLFEKVLTTGGMTGLINVMCLTIAILALLVILKQ